MKLPLVASVSAALLAAALCIPTGDALAQISPDTEAWLAPGAKRGHLEECPRYKRLSEEEKAKMQKVTLEELEKQGALLCSRCPGSETPGLGNPHLMENAEQAEAGAGAASDGLPESWVNPRPDEIPTHTFTPSPMAPLISMGPDGKLIYRPFSERGDRLMDWSYCGYKNSVVPIPDVPVQETLSPPGGTLAEKGNMAYASGSDSSRAIQAALNKVGQMPADADGSRGAVLLTKGTYYVNGGLNVPSGVVLRGEGDGEDGTILIMTSPQGGGNAITLGATGASIEETGVQDAVRIMDDYVPTGSRTFQVEDASQFQPGDFVHVQKTTNEAWIETLGMGQRLRHIRGGREGANKRPWRAEAYQLSHLRRIAAVDGNEITLDGVLPESIDKAHGGGRVFKVDVSGVGTHSGVESLRVVSNYDTTVQDRNKESNFKNFRNGIAVTNLFDGWVRNCTVEHVSFAAVAIGHNTRQITVRDVKSLQPVGPKRGGHRYAFNISGGSLHLFYNCYSEDSRHCFALGSRQKGPFAFVHSTSVRGGQSEPHHRWSTGALYDNVITKDGTLAAINRGDSGSGHGWAAANTMFWNCDARSIVVMNPETEGENNFAIGYRGTFDPETGTSALLYANDRAGYWGTPQEGKFFGKALMGSGHIESPDAPVEPGSLFQQQLIERIGAEQAAKVLQ
jgi:hypothetical protein